MGHSFATPLNFNFWAHSIVFIHELHNLVRNHSKPGVRNQKNCRASEPNHLSLRAVNDKTPHNNILSNMCLCLRVDAEAESMTSKRPGAAKKKKKKKKFRFRSRMPQMLFKSSVGSSVAAWCSPCIPRGGRTKQDPQRILSKEFELFCLKWLWFVEVCLGKLNQWQQTLVLFVVYYSMF